jgi:hypothetical protein
MECNDPSRGGSFYIQNKVYYAKEFLMQDFPSEENVSKYNPDYEEKEESNSDKKEEKSQDEKEKKEEEKSNTSKIYSNFKL